MIDQITAERQYDFLNRTVGSVIEESLYDRPTLNLVCAGVIHREFPR
jgi:hypothetical protein